MMNRFIGFKLMVAFFLGVIVSFVSHNTFLNLANPFQSVSILGPQTLSYDELNAFNDAIPSLLETNPDWKAASAYIAPQSNSIHIIVYSGDPTKDAPKELVNALSKMIIRGSPPIQNVSKEN